MSEIDRHPTPRARAGAGPGTPLCGAAALAVALVGAWGCGPSDGAREAEEVVVAQLEPTQGSQAFGTVEFFEDANGLRLRADVTGLEPGRHGFHVHQNGDCSAADASSAGPHFAFEADGAEDRITGNLGELTADGSGRAVLEAVIPRAELEGDRSILGRAVVVHERGNDPSVTPSGDAGARIACGVITGSRATRS